jgi:hypothetical protein
MAHISAGNLFRLLGYVRTNTLPSSFVQADSPCTDEISKDIIQHPFQYDDADIVIRSSDGKDFRVPSHSPIDYLVSIRQSS